MIPAGQTKTCTYTGIVSGSANTSVQNQIVAVGGGGTRSANATVNLTADPHIRIVKAVQGFADNDSSGGYSAGDILTFVLTASNTGNVSLTGVVVTDLLGGTSPVNCGAFNGTLAVGASISCTTNFTMFYGSKKQSTMSATTLTESSASCSR